MLLQKISHEVVRLESITGAVATATRCTTCAAVAAGVAGIVTIGQITGWINADPLA